MRLSQLVYFKTVTETGTISDAAKKLSISAPAVSIALANLEKELGANLFIRSGNRLILSDAGKVYLSNVTRILDELSRANEEVRMLGADGEPSPQESSPLYMPRRNHKQK